MDLFQDFKDLLAAFEDSKVDFVLLGGYAVAFHGHPRATKDIDLFVRLTDENRSRLADALDRFGAPLNVVESARSLSDDQVLFFGVSPLRVDILARASGINFDEVAHDAVNADFDGTAVRVISLDHLIINKRASGRPQDLVDAAKLETIRQKQ